MHKICEQTAIRDVSVLLSRKGKLCKFPFALHTFLIFPPIPPLPSFSLPSLGAWGRGSSGWRSGDFMLHVFLSEISYTTLCLKKKHVTTFSAIKNFSLQLPFKKYFLRRRNLAQVVVCAAFVLSQSVQRVCACHSQ